MASTHKLSIDIAADTLSKLQEHVDAGHYASISEAVEDAVRQLPDPARDSRSDALSEIRARIARSLQDPRPVVDCADAEQQILRHMQARGRAAR
ncbi:antitoxin ParD1/3/4 [Neorhizobium galegae]|uniref:ribbon-helix-helix domain-containing protein n=1 Tax=Neorhizobium galegae TaxID=399 RepID=UPI001AE6FBA1|nr:ribbon-helix-helix domain-containing protein [Neorhizobium galegae]MBP2547582.1 antitoxin ParD1/3/4 [Neorhizobium galegae]